ncbi:MAG: hypothetical protein HZC36_13890 [Armatimonadetes bacterium]|nr:hypothetical protein [Armatimonadota bacterium]
MNRQRFLRYGAALGLLFSCLVGPARAQSALYKIAAEILAAKFGAQLPDVLNLGASSGLSMANLAPIYSMSAKGNTKAETVWRLRQEGLGWGQVAHRIGMQPGRFNKLRRAGAFDSGRIWSSALGSRFGVPTYRVLRIYRRGASPEDAIGSILVARRSNRTPERVFSEYRRSHNWEPMLRRHNVDFDEWKTIGKVAVKAKSLPYPAHMNNKHKSSKSSGRAFGHDNASSKKGAGNGKSKGNGKGKAKGHGGW